MSLDAQPAESSPAPDAPIVETPADRAIVEKDYTAFRAARHAARTGTPVPETPIADPSPAEPVEQAASTEASPDPASEAGKPRKNAETRVQELLAERARERDARLAAERELAELRRARQTPDAKPAAPSPAPAETFPGYDEYLKAHPDASYEDYIDARVEFRAEQKWKAAQTEQAQAGERQRVSEAVRARDAKFAERIAEVTKADPEFMSSLSEDVRRLKPFDAIRDAQGRWTERPTGYHAIAEQVLASGVGPQLMRHFSDHPEDLHRVASLLPAELHKEIGKLESRYEGAAKPAPVAPKTVSSAPPPPTTLGTKPSTPGDPVEAAVAARDVTAFREARMRARLASTR